MQVREMITMLGGMDKNMDIREFEIQAYDLDDERWRGVTGVVVDPRNKTVKIYTDEL